MNDANRSVPAASTTEAIIAAAMDVHRALGPGLLESAYESCLVHELNLRGLHVETQVPLMVDYKGVRIDCAYRMDIVVQEEVVLEIKSVERLAPIHKAQLITYVKLSGYRLGLLLNFNVSLLKQGTVRLIC